MNIIRMAAGCRLVEVVKFGLKISYFNCNFALYKVHLQHCSTIRR